MEQNSESAYYDQGCESSIVFPFTKKKIGGVLFELSPIRTLYE